MKIELEIPKWAYGKPIYVIAGNELLAYKQPRVRKKPYSKGYHSLMIKVERCNGCGQCCHDCVFVRYDGCCFRDQIPLSCIVSDCSEGFDKCSERFRKWPG